MEGYWKCLCETIPNHITILTVHQNIGTEKDSAVSQQELTLEDLTQAAYSYRRLLAFVESESPTEAYEAVRLIIRLIELKQSALQQIAELEDLLDKEEG